MKKLFSKWDNLAITVKVSLSYTICSILQRCLSFITLPLFTRLLTTEEYGLYTVYQSWMGILSIFITLNLAYGSFSKAMVKYEDRRDEYISAILGICMSLSLAFIVIYLPFRLMWNKLFEMPTHLVLLMVFEILSSTAVSLWSGKKRFEFKYKSVILVTLLIAFMSPTLAYFLVINSDNKGVARIFGYALITIIIGGIIFVINIKNGKKLYVKDLWKYAFGFNIPLLAYYLSQVIFNQSDRIMISHMTGKSDAAMYGVVYNLAMILNFVLNAINNSYVPWLYIKVKNNEGEENRNVANVIAILMSLMILCIIWFAPEIVLLFAGDKYSDAVKVVTPIAISLLLLFYCQLFINIEFYYEEKKSLVYASIGAAIVNIVLNALFIPKFGYVVAGYTTMISYLIFALSNYMAMKKILKSNNIKDNLYDYRSLVIILLLFIAISFGGMLLYSKLIVRIVITVVVFVVFVINLKKFTSTISTIKKK